MLLCSEPWDRDLLQYHMNFWISLAIAEKKSARILTAIAQNLQISLGNIAILIILNLQSMNVECFRSSNFFSLPFFFCLFFLGQHPWHMEVPRLEVEQELQLLAYAIARQILNPLSKTRDRNWNLMFISWICFCCATTGTPTRFSNFFQSLL